MPSNTLFILQKAGYGLMNFTWVGSRKFTPEQFNATLSEVIDKSGASTEHPLLLNGAEFYGIPERHEGLQLLRGFFKAHPQYADKVYLSIKAGTTADWGPDTSTESLDKAVEVIDKYFQPIYEARKVLPKKLDMFTVARIGKEPVEDIVRDLTAHIKAGKIESICLSEINAQTLARAQAAGKIAAVEIEFSLFHREAVENGLFAHCVETNTPVVCYSPLGKGLLVGQKASELAKDDMRRNFDKFNDPEIAKHNELLVDTVKQIAEEHNLTPAQIALSWITTLSGSKRDGMQYPTLIPIPGSTSAKRQLNNLDVVTLDDSIMSKIDDLLKNFKTAGHRYNKQLDQGGYK